MEGGGGSSRPCRSRAGAQRLVHISMGPGSGIGSKRPGKTSGEGHAVNLRERRTFSASLVDGEPGPIELLRSGDETVVVELIERAKLAIDWFFRSVLKARVLINEWIDGYNTIRPHGGLGYKTPATFYATLNSGSR